MDFNQLRHFAEKEFNHPEYMMVEFLFLLDTIRHSAGIAFHLTSDARTIAENEKVGGSKTSHHLRGRAVDFVIDAKTAVNVWKVTKAVAAVELLYKVTFELKIEEDHFHLALQDPGDPGELIII